MASTADAGRLPSAWLQGPTRTRRRRRLGATGERAPAPASRTTCARASPPSRAQVTATCRRRATPRTARPPRIAPARTTRLVSRSNAKPRWNPGGGPDFRAGPPAATSIDIARRVRAPSPPSRPSYCTAGSRTAATPRGTPPSSPASSPARARCSMASPRRDGADAAHFASTPGAALTSPADDRAFFHGGYKVWDGGNDFADADDLAVFDAAAIGVGVRGRGVRRRRKSMAFGPSAAGVVVEKIASKSAPPSRPAMLVEVDDGHCGPAAGTSTLRGGRPDRAGRREAARAGGVRRAGRVGRAPGLRPRRPHRSTTASGARSSTRRAEKGAPAQAAVRLARGDPRRARDTRAPYALARSGASPVVTDDNVMFIFGGFVVEGRLGFTTASSRLRAGPELPSFSALHSPLQLAPVRQQATAVLDAQNRMWVWEPPPSGTTPAGPPPTPARRRTRRPLRPAPPLLVAASRSCFAAVRRRRCALGDQDGVMYVIGGEDYHSKRFLRRARAGPRDAHLEPARDRRLRGRRAHSPPPSASAWRTAPRSRGCSGGTPASRSRAAPAPQRQARDGASGPRRARRMLRGGGRRRNGPAVYDELFAAMLGTRSVVGDARDRGGGRRATRRPRSAPAAARPARILGDLGSGLLVESRGMWEHLLADVPDVGGCWSSRRTTTARSRAPRRQAFRHEKPRGRGGQRGAHAAAKDATALCSKPSRGGHQLRSGLKPRLSSRARARSRGTSGRWAPRPPSRRRRSSETFEEALDDLLDDFPSGAKKKKGRAAADARRRRLSRAATTKEGAPPRARRSSERRADETLDDVPRGAKPSKKGGGGREKKAVVARGLRRRSLPPRRRRRRRARRVWRAGARRAARPAAAARAGGPCRRRGRGAEDSRPIDPRSSPPARTARTRAVEHDKREGSAAASRLGAVSGRLAERRRRRARAPGLPFPSPSTTPGASRAFARRWATRGMTSPRRRAPATPETPETPEAAERRLRRCVAVVVGDCRGRHDARRRADQRSFSRRSARRTAVGRRLGDAGSLDPTDPDSEDYVAQMGSSPADTRKLWAQFARTLEKRRSGEGQRARRRRRRGSARRAPVTRARRPRPRLRGGLAAVDARGRARRRRPRRARLRRRRGGDTTSRRRWARASAAGGRPRGRSARACLGVASPRRCSRVLGGATSLATVGVFGMSKLATRLQRPSAKTLPRAARRTSARGCRCRTFECFRGRDVALALPSTPSRTSTAGVAIGGGGAVVLVHRGRGQPSTLWWTCQLRAARGPAHHRVYGPPPRLWSRPSRPA